MWVLQGRGYRGDLQGCWCGCCRGGGIEVTCRDAGVGVAGEGGVAAPWKREELSAEEQREWDEGFKLNSFNQFASDRISVHRANADVRSQA